VRSPVLSSWGVETLPRREDRGRRGGGFGRRVRPLQRQEGGGDADRWARPVSDREKEGNGCCFLRDWAGPLEIREEGEKGRGMGRRVSGPQAEREGE
jgi:hypothetical protein